MMIRYTSDQNLKEIYLICAVIIQFIITQILYLWFFSGLSMVNHISKHPDRAEPGIVNFHIICMMISYTSDQNLGEISLVCAVIMQFITQCLYSGLNVGFF